MNELLSPSETKQQAMRYGCVHREIVAPELAGLSVRESVIQQPLNASAQPATSAATWKAMAG